jgi:hypothetical protein
MALYTKLDVIGQVMAEQKASFWRIYSSAGETVGMYMKSTDVISPEESFTNLSEFVNQLQGDWVTIKVYTRVPNKTTEGESKLGTQTGQVSFTYRVQLTPVGHNMQVIAGNGGGSISEETVTLRVMIAEMKKDREIEKLERQLADKNSGMNGFDLNKELFGLAKEFFTAKKIESDLSAAADAKAAKVIAGSEEKPGVIGDSIAAIKSVMNGTTLKFIEDIGYYAKHDPENFKLNANAIMAGVDAFRGKMNKETEE